MPGTHKRDRERGRKHARARYVVLRRDEAWFIIFTGEEFGPYKTAREAKLFAIDAAYKLAEQGDESEVMVADEAGSLLPIWIGGRDPYPPRE